MATLVQSVNTVSGSGATLAVTIAGSTQWNIVVAYVHVINNIQTCTGVTDSAGNTYALTTVKRDPTGASAIYLAYGVQVTGGATTVTASFSDASVTKNLAAVEFAWGSAWADNADAYDTTQSGSGTTGTTLSVSTLTPSATGNLIISAGHLGSSGHTWTAGSGFTLASNTGTRMRLQYKLSGAATETCPMTINSNDAWAERAISLKAPAPAGQIPPISRGVWL